MNTMIISAGLKEVISIFLFQGRAKLNITNYNRFKLRVLCINTVLCVLLYNYQFTVYIVTSVVFVWAGLAQQDFLLF